MVPLYPSLYRDSHRERLSWERQKFHEITFLKIWMSNQKSTISNINRNSKHRKRTNQKEFKKFEFCTSSNQLHQTSSNQSRLCDVQKEEPKENV